MHLRQITNYYAYGTFMGDVSRGTGIQTDRYTGKELDRQAGLDLYDYGARQYDATVGLFTSMDPMCEQYYHLNPYLYCAGNSVRYVDPDGKEKKEYLTANEVNNSDYNLYPENTPGILNIWAHGIKLNKYDSYAWGIDAGMQIGTATEFKETILNNSSEWKKNQGENITIVLHSCSTSEFAKILSEDNLFKGKNITFIAPNATLVTNHKGSRINSKVYVKGRKKQVVKREEGKWMVYKDGKLVSTFSAEAQLGKSNIHEIEKKEGKNEKNYH